MSTVFLKEVWAQMKIGDFAKATGIPPSTLRYYEEKGLMRVSRDKSGYRCYAAQDIAWVQFIQRLKDTGMLLRDIRQYAALRYAGSATMAERLTMLEKHRNHVCAMQQKWTSCLQNLDDKIMFYRQEIAKIR